MEKKRRLNVEDSFFETDNDAIHYVVAKDCYTISYNWQERSSQGKGTETLVLQRSNVGYSSSAESEPFLQSDQTTAVRTALSFRIARPNPPE